MTRPTVSVVVSTYNAAWCIERALDSVLAQTRVPEEILVTDDGSTDDTVERIVSRYGGAVTLERRAHEGLTPTRCAGLELARGEWLALLDADDTWLPHKLERQLQFLERRPEVRWISSDGAYVSAEGVIRDSWLSDYFEPVRDLVGDLLPSLVERCYPLVSSTLLHAGAYHEIGGFDRHIAFSQDYDLWLRMAARYPAALMSDRLVTYFSSAGSLSRRYEARYRDDLELMKRVARGDLGRRPPLQRLAAERAAALEFDLALTCLRSGRTDEGRMRMRHASAAGPVKRRLFAACGALLPAAMLRRLTRSSWLKHSVQQTLRRARRQSLADEHGTES